MSKPIIVLGVFILLMGVLIGLGGGFLDPTNWESQAGLYGAASIRIVSGLILIWGASSSRYPVGLRIFGAVALLAGLILLFLPLEMWAGLLGWAFGGHTTLIRIVGLVGGTLLGLFLIHAGWPKNSTA